MARSAFITIAVDYVELFPSLLYPEVLNCYLFDLFEAWFYSLMNNFPDDNFN